MAGLLDILSLLSGQSQAAMGNTGLEDLLRTPPFMQGQQGAIPLSPQQPATTLTPPTYAEPPPDQGLGSRTAELALQELLAQPRQVVPQAPEPGLGRRLLETLPGALAILAGGFNPQAGQTAAMFIEGRRRERQAGQEQTRAEEQRQLDIGRQEQIGRLTGNIAEERRKESERRAEEREFRQFSQRQKEILGEQAFRANEAELTRMWQSKRDAEIERREDEKQKAAFDQQIKIQKGKLRKDFLDQGAGNYADELADYSLGVKDELSPGAAKANQLIQAKIARLQGMSARAAGGGGGGGGRTPTMQTFAELSDGNLIPAKDVKLDSLPPGVTVKRLFVPGLQSQTPQTARGAGGQSAAAAPQADLNQLQQSQNTVVEALKNQGKPFGEVLDAIRSAAPPPGVSIREWNNIKGQTIREAQRQYGYLKEESKVKAPPLPSYAIK